MRHAKVTFPFPSAVIVPAAIRVQNLHRTTKEPRPHHCPPAQDSWEFTIIFTLDTAAKKKKMTKEYPQEEAAER